MVFSLIIDEQAISPYLVCPQQCSTALSSGAPAGVYQGHCYTTTKFQLSFGAFGSHAPFIGTTVLFFSEGKGNRISPSHPLRGGGKPQSSPLHRHAATRASGPSCIARLWRCSWTGGCARQGWSAEHCGACGCPVGSPGSPLDHILRAAHQWYEPCYERGKVSKHSTTVFLDFRALYCAFGWGPHARQKEMLPICSQDEAGRLRLGRCRGTT